MAATTYFASHISENILITPPVGQIGNPGEPGYEPGIPGFIICKDAVLARTGWQTYQVADLPQDKAKELGVDISDPGAMIDLYRSPEEVFHPATVASFEGMPVTRNHPESFVARDTWREVACGHVQNVRKGTTPLESGDFPLKGDIVVNVDPLATEVHDGSLRELSCGYEYGIERDGEKIVQTSIRGNHVAFVPKGRAGPEARVYDAAPSVEKESVTAPVVDVVVQPKSEVKPRLGNFMKEKQTVKDKSVLRKVLLGLGFRALAADAETKPEELADAAAAMSEDAEHQHLPMPNAAKDAEEKANKEAADKRMKDAAEEEKKKEEAVDAARKAKDAEEAEAKKKEQEAKDAEPTHFQSCKFKDCMDRDCKAHRGLDSVLEKLPKKEGEDADMDELMDLMAQFGPQHAAGGDESSVIEPIPEEGMDAEVEKEKEMAKDKANAADAAWLNEEAEFIRVMKPVVARAVGKDGKPDKAAIAAFNQRISRFNAKSKTTNGSYAGVAGAARALDTKNRNFSPGGESQKQPDYSAYQEHLDKVRGKNPQEVK